MCCSPTSSPSTFAERPLHDDRPSIIPETDSRAASTLKDNMGDSEPRDAPSMEPSNSSSSSSDQSIVAPVPVRPPLPSRKSSGTIIVPRDSFAVGPVETKLEPDDVRSMSPRRTSQDIEAMGKEARNELQRHAKALQDSLLTIFHRIEAVKQEHDKLDSNNKFLQKYIGDLMATSKITAPTGRSKK